MPSKPSFLFKSNNRSQASVASDPDYASSASSEHRYRQTSDAQQHIYHSPPPPQLQSSNLSLERPPINVAAAVHAQAPATPADRAVQQPYASYAPQPDKTVNSPPEKKSLRSRLGLGHSSKDSTDHQSKDKSSLGRRVSVRKKEVPTQRPQSTAEDQQRYWQGNHLAPSHEAEEHNPHLDPFLQVQPESRSPAPPAKDPYYDPNNQAIGQSRDHNEYRRQSLARVNTEQSLHQSLRGRNSGEYQSGPHPHGNGGLINHNQPPPQYQSYAQPPQVQTYQNQQYQAFSPHSADSADSQVQHQPHEVAAQQEYHQQQTNFQNYPPPPPPPQQQQQQQQHPQQQHPQQQGQPGLPVSRQQQEQDLQFIQPEKSTPLQQQQYQPQQSEVHRTPVIRVPVQPQPQRPGQEQQTYQQQYIPPSPAPSQQSQNLAAQQTAQEFVITPVQESYSQQSSEQMQASAPNKRASDVPKGNMPPSRETSNLSQQSTSNRQTFSADVVPSGSQDQRFRGSKNGGNGVESEAGRGTPPPKRAVSDMSDEEVEKLVKEHEVLREKYQKVKRYFFEQQSQVHSLQNTLAHQRLSQSRTSLDDTEYHARFERLHGLVKQAAFAIRKIWKEIPPWLQTAVNHDAVKVGTREMTAVGRAVISKWLLDEVFNKFFHPDLDQHLSKQLKMCHNNIRKNAPLASNTEEEEALTSKLVNWRLATTEGFAEQLRGAQAQTNREHLIQSLNESLTATMEMYVIDPNHDDFKELKANVSPIVELAVNIMSHLPLESREIAIEHFPPGHSILGEMMTVESGIPVLVTPCAEGILQHREGSDAAERASLTSTASDMKDLGGGDDAGAESSQQSSPQQQHEPKRSGGRGMFSSIIGGGGKKLQQSEARQREAQKLGGDNNGGGSQVSLQSSAGPPKEEQPPRVRIATGMSVRIYGKGTLWKATCFPTA